MRHHLSYWSALSLLLVACGGSDLGTEVSNITELPYAEGSAEALAIVAVANDQSLRWEDYDRAQSEGGVGLHLKAAQNLILHRDGADATPGTVDDDLFDSLTEIHGNGGSVEGVAYCKRSCVDALLEYATLTGIYTPGGGAVQVVFSPTSMDQSHLAAVATMLDTAQESVDIAMYSYSHGTVITGALERALARDVQIRFLADTALANSSSKGKKLEEMGIDVRRVTKIMHHKFAIVDGPRDAGSLDRASTARIASGSGNWSSSAATLYDENTLFLSGAPEMTLRMQRDFDRLWAGSKDKVWESFEFDATSAGITDADIADGAGQHVWFTSANFEPNGNGGWKSLDSNEVSDALVEAIHSAQHSIHIATGHFRSEPINQALVEKMGAEAAAGNNDFEVVVVLDGQETSAYWDFIAPVEDAGADIRFKWNGYRWHYKYAKQMHHKYLLIDNETLLTGSYNYSNNAEHNTFENMMMFTGGAYAQLVAEFEENFQMVRHYGRDNNVAALEELKATIVGASEVPLFWDPISLPIDDVNEIKALIREHCPAADYAGNALGSDEYKAEFNQNPGKFYSCAKDDYPW